MEKEEYINSKIDKGIQFWSSLSAIFGSLFFMFLTLMDYIATPDNFNNFLKYRVFGALILSLIFILNRKKENRTYQLFLVYIGTIFATGIIEYMILKFGGHSSTYYAGIFIVVMVIVGFVPMNIIHSISLTVIALLIYIVPILIFDKSINYNYFSMPLFFLLSTFSIANVWRYLSQRSLVSELGLQYDLEQQREQLKQYSMQLEQLVSDRTKELSISETWHRSIFDNATEGIMVLDTKGNITNVNHKTCEMHGFDKEALVGVSIELLEAVNSREVIQERIQRILNGEMLLYETEHFKKDGTRIMFEISSKSLEIDGKTCILSFCRDITEKKRIQEQLIHSQKMESIGSLAGGIAHNFNNILTAILGYSELLLEFSNLEEDAKKRVRNIESASRKAGVMVSKLLSFARRDSHDMVPFSINDVINDSVKLFEGVMDKRIGMKINLSSNIPFIVGDPNQLEQVIMNLVVNARDAMPDGGLIEIYTGMTDIGQDSINIPAFIKPGKYIIMTVSDTGSGIPAEIKDKIFDPFFTTKEKGKGTGLGLATVYGIIKDHGGYISLRSEVGKGTSFDIYLPGSEKVMPHILKTVEPQVKGVENILVIDDDMDVLQFIRDMLETHGYTVVAFTNPMSAIELFKKQPDKIKLVITDIMMPLMEGKEVILNLRKIKNELKIIAISGYSDKPINNVEMMIDSYVKKPFEKAEMLSTVRRLLDSGIRNLPFY